MVASRPRVYYRWDQCEEFADGGGMWRVITVPSQRAMFAQKASDLMANPERFAAGMRQALVKWPRSCETNLTATNNNQRAWLGHAGCFLATGSPEECTRLGWHMLDDREQHAANAAADSVIREWERRYRSSADAEQATLWEDQDA